MSGKWRRKKGRFYSALYLIFGPFNVIVCRLIVADVNTITYSTLYSKAETSEEADFVQGRLEANAEDNKMKILDPKVSPTSEPSPSSQQVRLTSLMKSFSLCLLR